MNKLKQKEVNIAVIGLGYVKRDQLEPGTVLQVTAGPESVSAVVTALPFFSSSCRSSIFGHVVCRAPDHCRSNDRKGNCYSSGQ